MSTIVLVLTGNENCRLSSESLGLARLSTQNSSINQKNGSHSEEEEGETEQQQQFTKGCNILHRLQVYHLTLIFIIHNKYTSTLYLYTYMHIPIMIALIIMPFIDRINVRYKLLGTYIWEKRTRIHDYFFQLGADRTSSLNDKLLSN